ncbi:MAG: hypothetical protein JWM40_2168, partial [Frankiales bacterium]|nr:hypothetical protein [Frankiales bacterium]
MKVAWLAVAVPLLLGPTMAVQAAPSVVTDVLVHGDTGVGEPQLAVDPRHPGDVVVGENNTGVSVSHDAGRTWTRVDLPNQGDNTTTIDAAGSYAYTSLDGDLQVSKDQGRTWASAGNWVGSLAALWTSAGIDAVPFRFLGCNAPLPFGPVDPLSGPGLHVIGCDRPWLTADATVPGHYYVSFVDHSDGSGGALVPSLECKTSTATNQFFSCGRQYVTASRDGGRTWKPFVPVDSAAAPADYTNGFSGIPVARGGVLATAYLAGKAAGSPCTTCLVFQTSRDDGTTWTTHVVTSAIDGPSLGAHVLNPFAVSSSLAFQPYLAQDPSRAGRYAVMYFDTDQRALLVQVTSDAGRTWTKPVRLAEKGGVQRWLPWIAYGTGGALGVTWRTTYGDGSYATWAAVSPTGTTSFGSPIRLSSKLSPGPVSQVAGDDNSHVTLDRTTLHAAWGDRREGTLGIHYARYRFAADPQVRANRPRQAPALGALPATG